MPLLTAPSGTVLDERAVGRRRPASGCGRLGITFPCAAAARLHNLRIRVCDMDISLPWRTVSGDHRKDASSRALSRSWASSDTHVVFTPRLLVLPDRRCPEWDATIRFPTGTPVSPMVDHMEPLEITSHGHSCTTATPDMVTPLDRLRCSRWARIASLSAPSMSLDPTRHCQETRNKALASLWLSCDVRHGAGFG